MKKASVFLRKFLRRNTVILTLYLQKEAVYLIHFRGTGKITKLHNISNCLPGGRQKEYQHLRDLPGNSLMVLVFYINFFRLIPVMYFQRRYVLYLSRMRMS